MAPFTLISIPSLSPTAIHQDRELGFCFAAFRCTSFPDPYLAFESTMASSTFKAYFTTLPASLRNLALVYLGKCIDRTQHSLEDLATLVSANEQEKGEIMTSIAQAIGQEYEQRGMQKGIQQGMQQEKLYIAKNMLFSNEPKERIHQFTGLSWGEIEKLRLDQE